ncbi:THO complex subunit 1-like [Macrosteles quadrilineatus]|uniref:THO complex subunit 1-like n=1 Tax=Macrosteles quadrilineatus TaxID=74068 RepID=UPI0023E16B07|nr:THO complex subunit 1-like [Macrosteles quadrilineatus]
MSKSHSFEMMRGEFTMAVRSSMFRNDLDPVVGLFNQFEDPVIEKKAAVDQGFRDYLIVLLGKPQPISLWERFVKRCVEASQADMASGGMPVILLGDLFDCLTLDQCEQLFTFVEDNVAIWKEDVFFAACKNNLLRMCNDLLRRLSRSQNTVFCGRILLFLAKFFPFSERSGLNIVSEFNIDNITEFEGEENADFREDEGLDDSIREVEDQKMKIDFNLYTKFWSLQNFFRNPILIYSKLHWKTFTSHTENVLQAFKSFKLEGVQQKLVSADSMVSETINREHYFAKFLTNIKLLELQLSDVNFRRYVLVQFLILFQYLNATVKFKSDNQELKVNEGEWVKETSEKVYSLLKDTPPDGEEFARTIQHILAREEFWNNWKNDGCPELQKPVAPVDEFEEERKPIRRRRKRLGDIIRDATAQKRFYMGHPELTKLWNYNTDNLEACRAPERNFLMSLEEYFKEAIEQFDPSAMVEEQYKVVNDGNFGWRALRLLALQSTHFFTHSNNPINKLPEYLEAMIKKIAKERPIILPGGEMKTQEGLEGADATAMDVNETEVEPEAEADAEADGDAEGEAEGEGDAEEEDELLKRDEMNSEEQEATDIQGSASKCKVKPEVFDLVAQTINTQWAEMAEKLGFKDSIQYIEESAKTDVARAKYVLQLRSEEDVDMTHQSLAQLLEKNGFSKAATAVKQLM